MKVMRLSIVWPHLAPSRTLPVPTLHDLCLWSFLTHLPELAATSSLVCRVIDGAQSIHRVSRNLAYSQEIVLKDAK